MPGSLRKSVNAIVQHRFVIQLFLLAWDSSQLMMLSVAMVTEYKTMCMS